MNALDLIKEFEGCRLHQYICPSGKSTIGWGTTSLNGKPIPTGMTITQQQADAYLANDAASARAYIKQLVKVPITQNQTEALISFIYNIGVGAFKTSTLLHLLNEGSYQKAANQLDLWVHGASHDVLPGLVKRRKAEKQLFLQDIGGAD